MEGNHSIGRRILPSVKRLAKSEVFEASVNHRIFSGCFTALITPLRGKKIDEKAFQELVDWQVREGISGLVPCGTTGESPTLNHKEPCGLPNYASRSPRAEFR